MALLEVSDLAVSFVTRNGVNRAVDGISFTVESGQITAIIGESGSGKSVSCYSMLGLIPMPPGRIDSGVANFDGQDLLAMSEAELRRIRGRDIAMIFQDPMTCLNPFLRIGDQMIEPLVYHQGTSRKDALARAEALLDEVGIRDPGRRLNGYPHELSGGMRQRVMIAMALINEPRLLIADEPTTALDVTIQAQILELIANLQRDRDIGVIFISHDLAVVADIADQIAVMQNGKIVERGDRRAIFDHAAHPYTQKLLAAIPSGSKQGSAGDPETLISVRNLKTWFGQGENVVKAVDDVSFDIHRGEVLGLVGESGSGKSTIGRSILRLVPVTGGSIDFDGIELTQTAGSELKQLRRRMQTRVSVADAVQQLKDDVGLARSAVRKYPHEFSGGQRQRIAIGRALATRPEFVVADEPVSALDVTIQAQILELMQELSREYGLTMLFVSHDLAVVRHLADRIIVLYHGKIVEQGDGSTLFESPQNAYTQQLLSAIPGRQLIA